MTTPDMVLVSRALLVKVCREARWNNSNAWANCSTSDEADDEYREQQAEIDKLAAFAEGVSE